jgi:TPR repeat protein
MSFRTRATAAAFFVFAPVSTTQAQARAPVQTSIETTAPPPDNEFYSLREPAAAGDAQAQFALGNHYYRGLGVPQDYGHALIWYRKSAGHGNSNAENQLGYMAENGWGQPQSYDEAFSWYYSSGTWQRPRHGKHRL